MADIQQWMRGINTSRPSTPFSTHSEALAEGDTHPRNRHSSMQGVPSKSRRPPGARISTFLHSRRPSSSFKLTDVDREVSYSTKDDVYNPDPDQMANTLLSVIMSRPGKALPPEYGSFLLHVLEAFRSVKERLSEIRMDLTEQKAGRAMDLEDFQRTADIWANEKEIYKMEIKRLELLIAEGEGGMKAFSTAREGSVRTKSNLEPDEKADDHKCLNASLV
ncbi:MAG: hypothetical protein M1817_005892 [Caeruleum heppii]|nr:MAG: hypothetical protein M1817_005892 [Caeruleum heppii]